MSGATDGTAKIQVVCPHCDAVNRLPRERLGDAGRCGRCAKLNTEEAQALAARFQIRSIPTLAVFRGGREIARQAGALDAVSLERWVRSSAPA